MGSTNDYLKLHFLVFLWGFTAILGKLISVSFMEMVMIRCILASAGMYIVLLYAKESIKVSKSDFWKLLGVGFIVSLHWLAFFGSARIANVSVSLVGFATNSLWAALLEPVFNKTKVKKFELVLGLIVMSGLYVIFSFDFQYKLGLLISVFAGFTSALFSIFNSSIVNRVGSKTITFYEMAGAFISTGIFLIVYKIFWGQDEVVLKLPTLADWFYMLILAGVCSVYAYTVAIELMKKISVFVFQLCLNLEPVYGIIMAVLIFKDKEKMSLNFYLGTFIILCAVLSYPLVKKQFDKKVYID